MYKNVSHHDDDDQMRTEIDDQESLLQNSSRRTKYPGIKRPKGALQWNNDNYRVMIAEWLCLVKPKLNAFEWMKEGFRSLRHNFPVFYGYVFSWIAGISFANLIGYGYRVEDSEGGGFYVPKCHMLATAKKEYGDEVGSRICTHVCKVFTEEFTKTQGLDYTFEPNCAKGSCMIRATPPVASCCADNSLYDW